MGCKVCQMALEHKMHLQNHTARIHGTVSSLIREFELGTDQLGRSPSPEVVDWVAGLDDVRLDRKWFLDLVGEKEIFAGWFAGLDSLPPESLYML